MRQQNVENVATLRSYEELSLLAELIHVREQLQYRVQPVSGIASLYHQPTLTSKNH
jgi:hypothetical protein